MHTRPNGFTLIELMVVVAIIGLLSSIVLVSLSTARSKGRDARRFADTQSIQQAVELYFAYSQVYPNCARTTGGAFPGDPSGTYANTNTGSANSMICLATKLVPKYFGKLPQDPQNNPSDLTSSSYAYDQWCNISQDPQHPYRIWAGTELPVNNQNGWWGNTAYGVSNCVVAP